MFRVSVCIPVFNPGTFLASAIDSVLGQSFSDFELLIVDDASTQPVEATAARCNDARVRFEKNQHNLGLVGNWNRCLQVAQAEYVTIFHQDDLMRSDNLARKVRLLDEHGEIGFVYSNVDRINANGDLLGDYPIPQPQEDANFPGSHLFEMVARTGNPIACPTVMARTECYRKYGGFDARLPFATDLEMWLRLAAHCHVGYVAEPLTSLRVHPGQETARFSSTGRDYQDVLRALDIVFVEDLPPECAQYARAIYHTLARQSQVMARWQIRQGKISSGLGYAGVALKSARRAASISGGWTRGKQRP